MEDFELEEFDMPKEEYQLGFVNLVGEEQDGEYQYQFIFTTRIDEFYGEDFNTKPAGLCNEIKPYDEYVQKIETIKTKIKFDLIQNSCCFSYSDAMDGIVSICFENIDEYDSYPEDGRLFFKFGEKISEVERKLAIKNILFNKK